MSDSNWIKLNRKIWENFIWDFDKPQYAMAWIDMLLMANYKDKKILFDGKPIVVERGSFITSIVKLSERWNMNRRTVSRFLDLLQSDGMITYKSTHKCTTVFVCNYNAFQDFSDGECTTECTTECTQHKKVKNVKEGKENTLTIYERVLPDYLLSDYVKSKVDEWITYKAQRRESYQEQGMKSLLSQIQKNSKEYGERAVVELIDECMASGWKGIIFDRLKPKATPDQSHQTRTTNGGYRRPVQAGKKTDTQPSPERIKRSMDFLDKFLAEQAEREAASK